jgi:hypothetical protein
MGHERPLHPLFHFSVCIALLLTFLFSTPLALQAQGQDPDVYITQDDISFDPAEPFVGDNVVISAVIRNSGGQATDVAVIFKVGDEVIHTDLKPVVPASATSMAQWDTSGLADGEHTISVKVVATGDTNSSNDTATTTINLKKRPEALIVINSLTVAPEELVDGDTAEVVAEVENKGSADEPDLDVTFTIGETELGTKVLVLPKGTKKKANVTWETEGMEGSQVIKVVAGNATRTITVTVDHKPRARLVVDQVWLSENEPIEKSKVVVHAQVTNKGDAPDKVNIVFKDNVKVIGKKEVTFLPYETKNVTMEWTAKAGKRVIRVEVEGYPEAENHKEVDVIPISSRGCGGRIILVAVALTVGCVGMVRLKKKRGRGRDGSEDGP